MGQRVLWQMDHYRGGHGALNCPLLMRLDGALELDALQAAVDRLAARHESLRTTFAGRGPRLRQLVHDVAPPLPLELVELPEASVQAAIDAEVQTRCDPAQRPVRVTLWRLAAERHVLCVNMHHLVTDGWSTAVVADELGRLYAHERASGPALEPPGWQYAEWAAWHRAALEGDNLRRLRDYWRARLDGASMPALPRRASDVGLLERRTGVERATIAADAVDRLNVLARRRKTALFSLMLAVLYAALQEDAGGADPTVASIFANRGRREARSTVGFLSNMVVLRGRAREHAPLVELMAAADDAVIGAFAHQEL
ncbi:MAG: hypothetical protein QOJ85_4571, partial [Solirubrobacteraceae bacterium]|nr:hypothetical protein [Solirubrobacteraceae bacterium]